MKASTFAIALIAGIAGCASTSQPYRGQEASGIRGVSAAEIEQYRAGAGMGFARAAELNHYPGPLHALELADRLELSDQQRRTIASLMDAHRVEARAAGARVLEAERDVDAVFRASTIPDAPILAARVDAAARAQGEYRLTHLETHRRMRSILTDEQVARYDALRGYGDTAGQSHVH